MKSDRYGSRMCVRPIRDGYAVKRNAFRFSTRRFCTVDNRPRAKTVRRLTRSSLSTIRFGIFFAFDSSCCFSRERSSVTCNYVTVDLISNFSLSIISPKCIRIRRLVCKNILILSRARYAGEGTNGCCLRR